MRNVFHLSGNPAGLKILNHIINSTRYQVVTANKEPTQLLILITAQEKKEKRIDKQNSITHTHQKRSRQKSEQKLYQAFIVFLEELLLLLLVPHRTCVDVPDICRKHTHEHKKRKKSTRPREEPRWMSSAIQLSTQQRECYSYY